MILLVITAVFSADFTTVQQYGVAMIIDVCIFLFVWALAWILKHPNL